VLLDPEIPEGAVDYRNRRVRIPDEYMKEARDSGPEVEFAAMQKKETEPQHKSDQKAKAHVADLNDRGRGRTVETQGGGVAVVRAMWEFVNLYSHD